MWKSTVFEIQVRGIAIHFSAQVTKMLVRASPKPKQVKPLTYYLKLGNVCCHLDTSSSK